MRAEAFVDVILPVPLKTPLVYRVPAPLADRAQPGCRIKVTLGPRRVVGCILGETEGSHDFKMKDILDVLDDAPLLSHKELKLIRWASQYYLARPGEILRHLIPKRLFQWKEDYSPRKNVRVRKKAADLTAFLSPLIKVLSQGQEEALQVIQGKLAESTSPKPLLIHGVTGSGKTEIYLETARRVLESGGQALILVPEIGLTPQLVGRFRGLPVPVAVYHSALTEAERFHVWDDVRQGKTSIVVATRSGIFLKFPNLKLIVIDEEHDSSFKQEERFCYHARDLALWRAREENILVLLGSATPSMESQYRAQQGRLDIVRLMERPGGMVLPEIGMIDRRKEKKQESIFTDQLLQALKENFKKGGQSLLYLNRRGYAPFVLCAHCGFVPHCRQCDISLTLHRPPSSPPRTGKAGCFGSNSGENPDSPPNPHRGNIPSGGGDVTGLESRLVCHYCNESASYPFVCTRCNQGMLHPVGCGTEKIDSELKKLLPRARIARMDRDTTQGDGWYKILERMKRHEIDILIGTQMIAKGHDYPGLTLVGILDADVGLNLPDFRASERTFQLIAQVSGRAGRGGKAGRVLIQTYRPDHAILVAAATQDGSEFFKKELAQRQEAGFPPFRRLVEIRLAGADKRSVLEKVTLLSRKIRLTLPAGTASLLGPAPCPVEVVRGKSRWRILIKTSQYLKIQPLLRGLLDDFSENDLSSGLRMLVNVDPVDMT